MGSRLKYSSVSCIHPIFHLNVNPRPPTYVGRDTPDQAVDSFGNHDNTRVLLVDHDVQLFYKFHRFEILIASVSIRHPLPCFSRVVQIQHRGHSIHSQTIDVVPIKPHQRTIDEEVFDFGTAIIKNPALPLRMISETRVFVVVKVGSIEPRQSMRVVREMSWGPVHQNSDPSLMAGIHKRHKVFRGSKPTGGSKISGRLISPRSSNGCSVTGMSSIWVNPISLT